MNPPDRSGGLEDGTDDRRLAAHLRTLQRLAPGLAHDLRAPINAMVFNLEVLRETVTRQGAAGTPAIEAKLLRYAEILNEELNRLHERLETLFVFLRPGPKAGEPQPLASSLQQVAALLLPTASKRRITVRADGPDEEVAMPSGIGLREALLQVAVAALDGVAQGGDLTLEGDIEAGGLRLRIGGGPRQVQSVETPSLAIAQMLIEAAGGRLRPIDDSLSAEPAGGYEIEFPNSWNPEAVSRP